MFWSYIFKIQINLSFFFLVSVFEDFIRKILSSKNAQ